MNRTWSSSQKSRRGGVLLFSLIVSSVVAVLATCLLQLSSASARRQFNALEVKRAFYVSEAGLSEAYGGLRGGRTGNVGTAALPARLGEGLFWVEATQLDDTRVQLQSTGMVGLGRAVLSLVAERGEESVASLGVFSDQPLSIPAGVQVTGYDSTASADGLPVGEDPAPPPAGRVGSNEDIAVAGTRLAPTVVHADLASGPDHTIALTGEVVHVGTKGKRYSTAQLPDIESPFLPEETGITQSGGTPLVIAPGDRGLDHLTVGAGARVVIQGPCNLVLNDLTVAAKGQLEFDTELGKVSLWVLGTTDLQTTSSVSTTGTEPGQMLIQVPGTGATQLRGQGDLHAVIYAPNSAVTIGGSMRVYGAVVTDTLTIEPGARLSFDRNLDERAAELSLPRLLSWRVVEMSTASDAQNARDAFTLLGLDREALPRAADAHQDQVLHVVYDNLAGTPAVFDGMESTFDWSTVKEVHRLVRDGKEILSDKKDLAEPEGPSVAMSALGADPPLPVRSLASVLMNTSPLSSAELIAGINHEPYLRPVDLTALLIVNSPLGSSELMAMLDRGVSLTSAQLENVLCKSSPLPPDVLSRVLLGATNLNLVDRLKVLSRQ